MPQNADAVFYQLYLQTPEAEAALERDVRLTLCSFFTRYPAIGGGPQAAELPV
jgi:hypothetical protein